MTRLCPCGQMPDTDCPCVSDENPLVQDEPQQPAVRFTVLEPTVGQPVDEA